MDVFQFLKLFIMFNCVNSYTIYFFIIFIVVNMLKYITKNVKYTYKTLLYDYYLWCMIRVHIMYTYICYRKVRTPVKPRFYK